MLKITKKNKYKREYDRITALNDNVNPNRINTRNAEIEEELLRNYRRKGYFRKTEIINDLVYYSYFENYIKVKEECIGNIKEFFTNKNGELIKITLLKE